MKAKRINSNYIEADGHQYEKITNDNTVMMDFELEEDIVNQLDELCKREGFISHGEAILYVLREKIKEHENETK
jgi:ribulose-5-phosphate 4-epimerase/fuculose-1-phosphate aldolase